MQRCHSPIVIPAEGAAVDRLRKSMGDTTMETLAKFDPKELEAKVRAMYRSVAEEPHGEVRFEMGRKLAERQAD